MFQTLKNLFHYELNWQAARNISFLLALLSAAYLLFQTAFFFFTFIFPSRTVLPASVTVPEIRSSQLAPLEEFQKKIETRNPFFSFDLPKQTQQQTGIDEKIKKISLIGVVTSGIPEAILKDNESNQTYFIKRGQRLRDLEVKEIRKDSIVLKCGKDEKEIFIA